MENGKPLAIASVEKQNADVNALYPQKEGLCHGTIFPELDLPFFATEQLQDSCSLSAPESEEEALMHQIMAEGFFLDDLTLYIDTHCCDEKLNRLFEEHLKKKEALCEEYAQKYYPITRHLIPYGKQHPGCFGLKAATPPWERGCC